MSWGVDDMYCNKCGTQVPDDSVFCYKCGARLPVITGNQADWQMVVQENVITNTAQQTQAYQNANIVSQPTTVGRKGGNACEEEETPWSSYWTVTKLLAASIFIIVVGYTFAPGIFFYNIVIWTTMFWGAKFVKQYWKEKAFIKVVAVAVCAIVVMSFFHGLKRSHKNAVRENVRSGYSRIK